MYLFLKFSRYKSAILSITIIVNKTMKKYIVKTKNINNLIELNPPKKLKMCGKRIRNEYGGSIFFKIIDFDML
jgi:hypothetical protein